MSWAGAGDTGFKDVRETMAASCLDFKGALVMLAALLGVFGPQELDFYQEGITQRMRLAYS